MFSRLRELLGAADVTIKPLAETDAELADNAFPGWRTWFVLG